ncbi:MAG: cytochrome c biogenesis protein CcdA [Dehalococcoidales bacterium]|nr:cytochrome c biogenesis protein CcdA [Dehalococcoidales bacterium]
MEEISFLIAFSAGLLSFFSPCVLPLVPVYLASLAGSDIFDTTTGRRISLFLHSFSFVIGFSLIFSLWGAGAGLIGSTLVSYSGIIRQIVGSLLIVFGLFIIASLRISWLNYTKYLTPFLGTTSSYLRSFLTGSIFCFAWTPCLGWQITSILSLAGSSGTVWRGTYLLAVYSLGLGLPFLIMGIAFSTITPLLKHIRRYANVIYIISGLLLITTGILILTNRLLWFQM